MRDYRYTSGYYITRCVSIQLIASGQFTKDHKVLERRMKILQDDLEQRRIWRDTIRSGTNCDMIYFNQEIDYSSIDPDCGHLVRDRSCLRGSEKIDV